jgi:hypothetical protein
MQPGYVRELRWCEHPRLAAADALRAGGFVALELLHPLLTSRQASSADARTISTDERFRGRCALFLGEPSGSLIVPWGSVNKISLQRGTSGRRMSLRTSHATNTK